MEECKWIRPVLVAQFEFTEWTPDNHLRHSRFVALREDKRPMESSAGIAWLPGNALQGVQALVEMNGSNSAARGRRARFFYEETPPIWFIRLSQCSHRIADCDFSSASKRDNPSSFCARTWADRCELLQYNKSRSRWKKESFLPQ
jgi:hypothetical protein